MNKAVFLDRDGTIIEDVNYLSRIEDIRLIESAKDALRLLKDSGFLIIVVSNQSGIGRGYFTSEFVDRANAVINEMVDGLIDEFYYCPHRPEDNCNCRKPKTRLVDEACERFAIDRPKSFVIGDKESDVELGINASIEPILVLTGYGKKYKDTTKAKLVFNDIYEAARWICQKGSMG